MGKWSIGTPDSFIRFLEEEDLHRPGNRFQALGFEERLPVQLVPQPTWGVKVESILGKDAWRTLRALVWERYGTADPDRRYGHAIVRCSGCNQRLNSGDWHAHEVWEYDDTNLIQELSAVVPICPRCHEAVHIGRAHATGRFPEAVQRLRDVNNLQPHELDSYLTRHFALWERRSEKTGWEVRVDYAIEWLNESHESPE